MDDRGGFEVSEHWRKYLDELVAASRYKSIDDAIVAGLQLLEAEEIAEEQLMEAIRRGEELGGFEPWDYHAFMAEEDRLDAAREAA